MVMHFAPHTGGAAVVSTELANAMAKMGHQITVLTPNMAREERRCDAPTHENVRVVRYDTPFVNNPKIAARMCRFGLERAGQKLGEDNKFDFVLTVFHPFHLIPNAAVSCARRLRIPCMVKIDDALYADSSGLKSVQRRVEKIISTRMLRRADKILVVNDTVGDVMGSFYGVPKEKISIVPNGVDLTFFKSAVKDPKKIVFSGMMYDHRGLEMLLDAAAFVIRKAPDARFVLLGGGPEMPKLQESVSKMNLDSNVMFRGWVDRRRIPADIADASVAVVTLKQTTVTRGALPIKALEYMASSIPMVASKGTLPRDVLVHGHNGYFVEDADDLATRIIELLGDPVLVEKMGHNSLAMVQKFAWENIADSIISEYEKC